MTNYPTGNLYIFEGPDNVGKTTVAKSITNLLSKTEPCEYLSFPGKEPGTVGGLVYDLHHDKQRYGLEKIDPTSLQAMHIAAHIDCISRRILPLLQAGTSVVLDRYWWSTWVYGQASDANFTVIDQLIKSERLAWQEVEPSCIFYLRREFPGAETSTTHNNLISLYEKLFKIEAKKTKATIIHNKKLSDTVSSVLAKINSPKPQPASQKQGLLLAEEKPTRRNTKYPPSSLSKLLGPTVVFDTYWKFAAKRQEIFFARLKGESRPWTNDPILLEHKFTNAYRASDRVSQYLIKKVIYSGSQDAKEVFFRTILFKLFNKIETWELLQKRLGEVSFETFKFEHYDKVLTEAIEGKQRIYSAAYIMPTGGRGTKFKRKHRMHLDLVRQMMADDLPLKIADAKSMGKVFEMLLTYPGIGDFLAYQYASDLNYSELTDFPETQFVVPGPGAKDGIRKCFTKTSGLTEAEIIKVVMENQNDEFERLGIEFKSLWGRPLRLIDCQNLFCETDKYARVRHPEIKGKTGRSRIKQKFHPNPTPIQYWYPPKWGINEVIQAGEHP